MYCKKGPLQATCQVFGTCRAGKYGKLRRDFFGGYPISYNRENLHIAYTHDLAECFRQSK